MHLVVDLVAQVSMAKKSSWPTDDVIGLTGEKRPAGGAGGCGGGAGGGAGAIGLGAEDGAMVESETAGGGCHHSVAGSGG